MPCSRPGWAGSGCCSMPTRMAPVDRLVRVGTGRDAKDVAFCTIFGPVSMTGKTMSVRELQDERAAAVGRAGAERRAGRHRKAGAGEPDGGRVRLAACRRRPMTR